MVAGEGVTPILIASAALGVAIYQQHLHAIAVCALIWLLVFLIFRDPIRKIPPSPLGVVSPVDGRVVSVTEVDEGVLQGKAWCIRFRVHALGAYTARSPSEGQVHDLRSVDDDSLNYPRNALWVQTDEGNDVVLTFSGYCFGMPPKALLRYGERVGQGWRVAYLRLARYAEVQVEHSAQVLVEPGTRVQAGSDLIAKLPAP